MATIFFTSIGSMIGSSVGFPSVGKFLGGEFASYFYAKIFNSKKIQSQSNQRLDDLFIQSSSYGRVIPILFGTFRIAGNIIWAMPIKEILSTELINIGGGGGGFIKGLLSGSYSSSSTIEKKTYNYYINIAIGICEGVVDSLIRIWADNILLDLNKLKYRFYDGSDDQLPDNLISSTINKEDPSACPAFRGLCYIVIEDFHINPYGNRIPNFTFEVKRSLKTNNSVENKIKAVNIIPGASEFVYDTKIIFKKQIKEFDTLKYNKTYDNINEESIDIDYEFEIANFNKYIDDYREDQKNNLSIISSQREAINNSTENSFLADSLIGLDQLQENFKFVRSVNLVVSWFVSSLDLKDIELYPAVEFRDIYTEDINGSEEKWSVFSVTRNIAKIIGRDPQDQSKPNYGGTPSDSSIYRYLSELKKRGFNVILYPMIFVDKYDKPWRGLIEGDAVYLDKFFKNNTNNKNTFSYFDFIEHYAKSFKDLIDGIIIGSELKSITKIYNEININGKIKREFPAVKNLCELASNIRNNIFQDSNQPLSLRKKIIYASDWSEYHHTDDGYFHLDELHASPDIDFIGIDAYFPLTDSKSLTYIPSKDEIKKGFESGEGYEYYYNDKGEKIYFDSYVYAWKNLIYWWENEHINPDGEKTSWIPKSKKIWFSEFGFPSLHGASNSPNVFFNPGSSSSSLPKYSNGTINFDLQALCIDAFIEYWTEKNNTYNIIENMSLWCFDARPYPYFPLNNAKWSDGLLYEAGHWINGKFDGVLMIDIFHDLFSRIGLDIFLKNNNIFSDLYMRIDGFCISSSNQTILDTILLLQKFYPFDIIQDEKSIKFLSKANKKDSIELSDEKDLILMDFDENNNPKIVFSSFDNFDNNKEFYKYRYKIDYSNTPSSVSLNYFSKENAFEPRLLNFSYDDIDV
jgi:hypothetical protein